MHGRVDFQGYYKGKVSLKHLIENRGGSVSKPTMPNRRDGMSTNTLWRLSDGVMEAAGARTTKKSSSSCLVLHTETAIIREKVTMVIL